MKNKILIFLLLGLGVFNIELLAQHGDPALLTTGIHTGNRIGISFHNDGQIAGIISGVDIHIIIG